MTAHVRRRFTEVFQREPSILLTVPGRTELGGNHTDHQNGCVLAAAVDLKLCAAAAPTSKNQISLYSKNTSESLIIDLANLAPINTEKGSTTALIKGVAASIQKAGYLIGGCDIFVGGNLKAGLGLSSSAAFEVLIGGIFNTLFNDDQLTALQMAKFGQIAENQWFGKPCGLMDQLACAVGGVNTFDFANPENPIITPLDFNLEDHGLCLTVLDTGSSHADLTNDYAAIPADMKAVAKTFGMETCRDLSQELFLENLPGLRKKLGDRALLRVMHFLTENERVLAQSQALKSGDLSTYLQLCQASGNSSWQWLQNVSSPTSGESQSLALALALTQHHLAEAQAHGQAAWRVHGGGFAGAIQIYLPQSKIESFRAHIESIFGTGALTTLKIRSHGIQTEQIS